MPPRVAQLASRRPTVVRVVSTLLVAVLTVLPVVGLAYSANAGTQARGLLASAAPDRSAPHALQGATASGNAYIFVGHHRRIMAVEFYLDDSVVPHRVETRAPWDLGGTAADGSAVAFDTANLPDGAHRLRAVVKTASETATLSASFRTANAAGFPAGTGSLFAPTSPFNQPIPVNPALDVNSAALVRQLAAGSHIADAYEYAAPTYHNSPSDPAYTITNVTYAGRWGPNPFARLNPVRIPDTAAPAVGDDGWMVIVDRTRQLVFTMWRARKVNGNWQCDWAGIYPLGGVGNDTDRVAGFGNGAGLNIAAGLVTVDDVRAGRIDHALVFSTDMGHPSEFRYPATKTDAGNWPNQFNPKLPQGTRVQLDPSINVDAIPGITPIEKMVAKALQRYGAYNNDHGGARMAFVFEGQDLTDPSRNPPLTPGNPTRRGGVYYNAGLHWDYFDFSHIPWDRLRVLRSWDGK